MFQSLTHIISDSSAVDLLCSDQLHCQGPRLYETVKGHLFPSRGQPGIDNVDQDILQQKLRKKKSLRPGASWQIQKIYHAKPEASQENLFDHFL